MIKNIKLTQMPKWHYVQSVHDAAKPYPRLRLLDGQWIPQFNTEDDETIDVIQSEDTWNISGNNEKRSEYTIGTVFSIKNLQLYTNAKKVSHGRADPHWLEPIEEVDAMANIRTYDNVVTGKTTLVELDEEPVTEEEEETPAPVIIGDSTYLEDLLKENPCPGIGKTGGFYITKKVWNKAIYKLHKKQHVLFKGESGLGKTEIAEMIAKQMNMPVRRVDFGTVTDTIDLIGTHIIDADGTSKYNLSPFMHYIQEPVVILLDEINRAPADVGNVLFPLLDRHRAINLSQVFSESDRVIKVHPECLFMATANIGHKFTGTNQLDVALKNRFLGKITLGYLTPAQELQVLMKNTGIDKAQGGVLLKVANAIRSKLETQQLTAEFSTRQTLSVAQDIADGWPLMDALESFLSEEVDDVAEYKQIEDILQAF